MKDKTAFGSLAKGITLKSPRMIPKTSTGNIGGRASASRTPT